MNTNYYLDLELSQNLKSNVRKILGKINLKIILGTINEEKDYSELLAGSKGFDQ